MEQKDKYKRQTDLFNPQAEALGRTISIIGVGGIGSWAGLILAKLGIQNLIISDPDKVENHNLASQFYDGKDLGKFKVEALKDKLSREDTNLNILIHQRKWKLDLDTDLDIFIISVDSLKERVKIVGEFKKKFVFPKVLIDARMGGEQLEIYTSYSLNDYIKSLPNDADNDLCTAKSIVYNTSVIGGLIANQVKRLIKNQSIYKEIIFDLSNMHLIKVV